MWRKLLWVGFGFVAFTLLLVIAFGSVNPPTWMWKLQRQLAPPAGYPEAIRHSWVSLEKISPNMQLAVIAAEDQNFPSHWGFDLDSIVKAIEANQQGAALRGASTLSQQTAKNLFLWSEKSLLRKGVEAYFTGLIELFWSKQRILEVYLNIVEFGPGIFGVEAASRHFYGKPAGRLTADEAARLAVVLPNPYQFQVNRPSTYQSKRIRWIKRQMRQLGAATLDKVE